MNSAAADDLTVDNVEGKITTRDAHALNKLSACFISSHIAPHAMKLSERATFLPVFSKSLVVFKCREKKKVGPRITDLKFAIPPQTVARGFQFPFVSLISLRNL